MAVDEKQPLINGDQPAKKPFSERIKEQFRGKNALLLIYLALVIVSGTANRLTFKIMQNSIINYSYFVSQLTTFLFIPINFIVIAFKMWFTKSITPEMRRFPTKRFAIMGLLDSLQGLFIVVGGIKVPGGMQALLMQGAVPVTMIFSIIMLRPSGCSNCNKTKKILNSNGVKYRHVSTLPKNCDSGCICKVTVNGMEVDANKLHGDQAEGRDVVFESSSRDWLTHTKRFYQPNQWIGALVIIGGIILSLGKSFQGGTDATGPVGFDLLFFCATIPTAISGVYKEIAFRDQEDMDVWYLNGWVALFQFLFGLPYAPLAAKITGLPIKEIPTNLYRGFLCWLIGANFIKDSCLTSQPCGDAEVCCDSCDGSNAVSDVSAFWGVFMYMVCNLAFNVFLILVIKYGSAALMYIGSTLVLPISSVLFTVKAIMGRNAVPFTAFTGAGLGVVLFGLIIYRFLGRKRPSMEPNSAVPIGGLYEPTFVVKDTDNPEFKPRTRAQIRNNYYTRLGFNPEQQNAHINV